MRITSLVSKHRNQARDVLLQLRQVRGNVAFGELSFSVVAHVVSNIRRKLSFNEKSDHALHFFLDVSELKRDVI